MSGQMNSPLAKGPAAALSAMAGARAAACAESFVKSCADSCADSFVKSVPDQPGSPGHARLWSVSGRALRMRI